MTDTDVPSPTATQELRCGRLRSNGQVCRALVPSLGEACSKHVDPAEAASGDSLASSAVPAVLELDLPTFAAIHELVFEELRERAPEVSVSVADDIGREVAERITDWPDFPVRGAFDFYIAPVA